MIEGGSVSQAEAAGTEGTSVHRWPAAGELCEQEGGNGPCALIGPRSVGGTERPCQRMYTSRVRWDVPERMHRRRE